MRREIKEGKGNPRRPGERGPGLGEKRVPAESFPEAEAFLTSFFNRLLSGGGGFICLWATGRLLLRPVGGS